MWTYKGDKTLRILKKLMIRHTKAMHIGGAEALKLPDLNSETVWLQMSARVLPVYYAMLKRRLHKSTKLQRCLCHSWRRCSCLSESMLARDTCIVWQRRLENGFLLGLRFCPGL
jgi:hypothetical protein